MIIDFSRSPSITKPLTMAGVELECVHHFKLLGVWIADDLAWDKHVASILSKVSQRLYFLLQLKRSGLGPKDLLTYYQSIIRPVLEYACQVWHPGLNKGQSDSIEAVQKRALRIVYPGKGYTEAISLSGLPLLGTRREEMCRKLFGDISRDPNNKLHHLLPERIIHGHHTRYNKPYPFIPKAKTQRYKNSFIPYCLFHFQ